MLTLHFILPFLFSFIQTNFLEDYYPVSIIPEPLSIEYIDTFLVLKDSLFVLVEPSCVAVCDYLSSDLLSDALPIYFTENQEFVNLNLRIRKGFKPEAYSLSITPAGITIIASSSSGIFYGLQSLKQLYVSSSLKTSGESIILPSIYIYDEPRFSYRGMHLDVSRHFFPVEFIKRFIDFLAYHKLNYFHWHLTDDQGWRIEIKKYPKLTEIGAVRKETRVGHASDTQIEYDNQIYTHFYTQEEILDIVAYAKDRYITIIPEIEMPGHALSALAAYPELSCIGGDLEVATTWGVFEDVFCTKDEVFTFLEGVLDEVSELFPGRYVHIGGDECPKTRWKECEVCQMTMRKNNLLTTEELQSYFIQRIEKYLNAKGKSIIGWDEIFEGGLAPNASLMAWRGISVGVEAAESGHDVIMTPTSHCYFDYYQSTKDTEPLAIGGYLPLKKVYEFDPVPKGLSKRAEIHILGAQANVWTEYIRSEAHCEYMLFPRLCALAEVNWTAKENVNWSGFVHRLKEHHKRLSALSINYANHLDDIRAVYYYDDKDQMKIRLETEFNQGEIFYTFNAADGTENFQVYNHPITLKKSGILYYFGKDKNTSNHSDTAQISYTHHLAQSKNLAIIPAPDPFYPGQFGNKTIVDGFRGSKRFNGSSYIGFFGEKVELTIPLDSIQWIKEIDLGVLKSETSWIYLPETIQILASDDGIKFMDLSDQMVSEYEEKNRTYSFHFEPFKTMYLKFMIHPINPIPAGSSGAGNPAWIFIDEIIVK